MPLRGPGTPVGQCRRLTVSAEEIPRLLAGLDWTGEDPQGQENGCQFYLQVEESIVIKFEYIKGLKKFTVYQLTAIGDRIRSPSLLLGQDADRKLKRVQISKANYNSVCCATYEHTLATKLNIMSINIVCWLSTHTYVCNACWLEAK